MASKRQFENEEVDEEPIKKKKKKKRARFNDDDDIEDLSQSDIKLKEADTGIVERVYVSNFMCHKKLEVRLGPNVNFIIGRNGSGKSAILSAIIVGLGGKAAATNRGNSLKGFIKEGCHASSVEITLRNQNKDAYRHDDYGDSIIVERRIANDGTGSYKIKSKEGKIVSQKKEELVNILDHFNIQIDNPVSILTQETSRCFLNTSNPKDKYAFFLKATHLERLTDDYQKIFQEKDLTKLLLERKKKVIPDLLNEVRVHEEKYNDMQQLQKMKTAILELKQELCWAHVNHDRKMIANAEKAKRRAERNLPTYEQSLQNARDTVEAAKQSYEEKREELTSFRDEASSILGEKHDRKSQNKRLHDDVKKCEEAFKKINKEIKKVERDRGLLLAAIEAHKNTAQKDYEAERIAREADLEDKRTTMKQYESQLSVTSNYYQQIEANVQMKKRQKNDLQNAYQEKERDISRKKGQLEQLEAQNKNKLAVFGEHTASILKMIDEAHKQRRFHRKPVGPIGSLVTIKDQQWAMAVEEATKGVLMSYVCTDSHDMKILRDIFKRAMARGGRTRGPPPIIMSSFTDYPYDISRNRPGPGFTSVLDVLEIEDVIASNTLIDNANVETVLLIENARQAQNILWSESTRPRNSTKAYSKEGHQIIGGRLSKYYPCKPRRLQYFRHDTAGSMREIESEMQQMIQEKKSVRENMNQLDVQIRQDEIEKKKTYMKKSNEQSKISSLKMEIQDLLQHEENKAPDICELETELEEFLNKLDVLQVNRTEAEDRLNEKKEKFNEDQISLAEFNERFDKIRGELESAEARQTELEEQFRQAKGVKKHYEEQLVKLKEEISEAEKKVEQARKDEEKTLKQALEYCEGEEITTTKKVDKITSEIQIAQRRISEEEGLRGNADEIINKYHEARTRYDTTREEFSNVKKNLQSIERALDRRVNRFKDFRRFISRRAQSHFSMLLSQRGYSGKLTFQHADEELLIQVNVEKGEGSEIGDSRSLSGGERSFSTICFIMSMWDAMEGPFRCLDEFDVFMDMLNRRISMNMLLKIAKEQVYRQFILLTPQDMSYVSGSDRVRIFKLNDPERGQQTLPYEAE